VCLEELLMKLVTVPLALCVLGVIGTVGFIYCLFHATPYAAADRLGLKLRVVMHAIVTFFE
jgi:hypothetical protein